MRILSFQPSSLYQNGGAGRVLRRLYQGHELQIISFFVNNFNSEIKKNEIKEINFKVFPSQKVWMRWKLRSFFSFLRENLFFDYNKKRILKEISILNYDVVHIINHGKYSTVLYDEVKYRRKKIWASFHDHFSLCSSYEDAKKLWEYSDRIFVISEELGLEYQKIFSKKNFLVITDGVYANEISKPKEEKNSEVIIYFAGLLHIDYMPLFCTLGDALDEIKRNGKNIKLVLRGSNPIKVLENRLFNVEFRTNFISDEEIKIELDSADILYLPIKFNLPDFYLYSLSTKMISYLGGAGAILYHGPSNSAAINLLKNYNAAIPCFSLKVEDMVNSIAKILNEVIDTSNCAKKLAKERFDLVKIQEKFWKIL